MSKDSVSIPTVQQIFESMDYGSVTEGQSSAKAWLKDNASNVRCFLNGKLQYTQQPEASEPVSTGASVRCIDYISPSTSDDYDAALTVSSTSFTKWATTKGHTRASLIYSIARQLQKHASLLCELEAMSRGVQMTNVREVDVPALIRTFYYYAGWAQLLETQLQDWKPSGPVIGVSSNNTPLASLGMFIAPVLSAGSTVTLLPDATNCLSALLLAQLCTASGVPPGVINVVPWHHPIENLTLNGSYVKKVTVIGSPCLGRSILQKAGAISDSHLMLLNGCVPMLILDSADLDAAVDCVIDAACHNQGQDPWGLRLIIAQDSVYAPLKSKLLSGVSSLKSGPLFEKEADISDTVKSGCIKRSDPTFEIVQPEGTSSSKWAPTLIFSASPPSEPVLQASDSYPVIYVVGARSAKEATAIANHYGHGVAASVWTENSAFAMECSLQLKTSTVWINNFGVLDASVPISGRCSSGSGCFLGKEGLMEYLEPSNVTSLASLKDNCSNSISLVPVLSGEPTIDQTLKLFYGGGHKRPNSNMYKTVLNGNGKIIAAVPEANRKDIRDAVEHAVKAQASWWKRGHHNRAQILYNLAEKLHSRRSFFASCLHSLYEYLDHNKCLSEVDESVKLLFHCGALCDKMLQSTTQTVGDMVVIVRREPLGVIATVCSNAAGGAFAGLVALVGVAIAYGNTCISVTDLEWAAPSLEFALLLEAAEVPAGVINILSGVANTLLPTISGHMEINAVWCTGMESNVRAAMQKESSRSNLKQIWVMNEVLDPCSSCQTFENKASQSKAIWLSGLASFGS